VTGANSDAWRLSRVEKKILRCVAAGATADFTADAEGGSRPEVSGEFLARLWLGLVDGAKVHPLGIGIKGLAVTGSLNVEGARQSADGRDSLVGLSAEECTFEGVVALGGARLESLILTKCELPGVDLEASTVVGTLAVSDCRLEELSLGHAHIHGRVYVASCTVAREFTMFDAVIDGPALFVHCVLTGAGAGTPGFNAAFATLRGGLMVTDCRIRAGLDIRSLSAQHLLIKRCRIGRSGEGYAVSGGQLRTAGSVVFDQVRADGPVALPYAEVGGRLAAERVFVVQPDCRYLAFDLTAASVGQDAFIRRSVFRGYLNLSALTTAQVVDLSALKVTVAPGLWALLGARARMGELRMTACRLTEPVAFNQARVSGNVSMRMVAIGPEAAARRYAVDAQSARSSYALSIEGAQIDGALNISQCYFQGQLSAGQATVNNGVWIAHSVVESSRAAWSVQLQSLSARSILLFDNLGLTSGLSAVGARCQELQFQGCDIASFEEAGLPSLAIWASDLVIDRRLSFGVAAGEGLSRCSHVCGALNFQNCQIGENVLIASVVVTPSRRAEDRGLAIAINLGRSRIAGDLVLADRRILNAPDSIALEEAPARVHGCVAFDDAEIAGDVILHRTHFVAEGAVNRPKSHVDLEERVTKRKRGVAISMRGAKIAGELELGKPTIQGLVDLRDADVALVSDGSGRRWRRVGCKPGHLLLDGLTYRDLDDLWDGDDEDGVLRPQSEAALERLRWLDMQYPDGPEPDLFVPQPYEQLARIFTAEGNERARRQVLVAKRDLQRRHGRLSRFERAVGWILKQTSDYGYSPLRAVLSLLIFIAVGSVLAWLLDLSGAMVLATTDAAPQTPFNPIVYAIDAAIPIADLNQDDLFTIDAAKLPGWARSEAAVTLVKAAYEIVGLILASVAVLTLTGTLREKE